MDSCACSCDLSSECYVDVYEAHWRVARKPHHCCECLEIIEPGQRYEYASLCFDGSWGHAKTCELCVRIRNDLCPCGFCHGELRDTLWQCLDFDYITGEERPPARVYQPLAEVSS